jgi:hypothetical protein
MTPQTIVQQQLEAYNARDLPRFLALYAEDVKLYRLPQTEPSIVGRQALGEFYATQRFNLPGLHADVLNRMVVGNKVIDHERVSGVRPQPFEAVAAYAVVNGLIQTMWFMSADPD